MRYAAAFLAVLFVLSSSAYAHRGGNVDIEILSDRGDRFLSLPFKDFEKESMHIVKRYLEAKRGENYSIVVRNNMPERIGVVVAVDGRNIITGKKSNLKNDETMYIVDPYGSTRLEGWRTDKDTVHRFYFTDIKDSYAVRTFDDTSAMGVIAVAVFREKERPKILFDRRMNEGKAAAPSGRLKGQGSEEAGTGFGDGEYSPTIKVEFEPEASPFKKILVKYEWREVLCKKGLLRCKPEAGNRLWDEDGYAPFPPGFRDP